MVDVEKCVKKRDTYIGIELADKAREVVVFEVIGKKISCKLRRSPYHKRGFIRRPRHNVICERIIHQLISLCQKRCWRRLVFHAHHCCYLLYLIITPLYSECHIVHLCFKTLPTYSNLFILSSSHLSLSLTCHFHTIMIIFFILIKKGDYYYVSWENNLINLNIISN